MDTQLKKLESLRLWVAQIHAIDWMSKTLAEKIASSILIDLDRIDAEAEVADGEERLAFQYAEKQ